MSGAMNETQYPVIKGVRYPGEVAPIDVLILYLFLELRWEAQEEAFFWSSYLLKTVMILLRCFRARGREKFSETGCEFLH